MPLAPPSARSTAQSSATKSDQASLDPHSVRATATSSALASVHRSASPMAPPSAHLKADATARA
ncbi:MAG: hypothetical protein ACK56F_13600, partial [bacterium]